LEKLQERTDLSIDVKYPRGLRLLSFCGPISDMGKLTIIKPPQN
jgi:hypothetical protein